MRLGSNITYLWTITAVSLLTIIWGLFFLQLFGSNIVVEEDNDSLVTYALYVDGHKKVNTLGYTQGGDRAPFVHYQAHEDSAKRYVPQRVAYIPVSLRKSGVGYQSLRMPQIVWNIFLEAKSASSTLGNLIDPKKQLLAVTTRWGTERRAYIQQSKFLLRLHWLKLSADEIEIV